MNEQKARAYLSRKGKVATQKEVDRVMKQGKIYGDPIAVCE